MIWKDGIALRGGQSEPPAYHAYQATNYQGVGLSLLQATRLKYIITNYGVTQNGVANAIWAITNTGGAQNSVYLDAVDNAASDGSEGNMVFMLASNSSYQNMIVWKPDVACTLTAFAGNDLDVCEGENTTLSGTANGGTAPYSYQWTVGSPITYQAENGTVGGGAQIENVETPFGGTGYIEYYQNIGEYFEMPHNNCRIWLV